MPQFLAGAAAPTARRPAAAHCSAAMRAAPRALRLHRRELFVEPRRRASKSARSRARISASPASRPLGDSAKRASPAPARPRSARMRAAARRALLAAAGRARRRCARRRRPAARRPRCTAWPSRTQISRTMPPSWCCTTLRPARPAPGRWQPPRRTAAPRRTTARPAAAATSGDAPAAAARRSALRRRSRCRAAGRRRMSSGRRRPPAVHGSSCLRAPWAVRGRSVRAAAAQRVHGLAARAARSTASRGPNASSAPLRSTASVSSDAHQRGAVRYDAPRSCRPA